MVGAKGHQLIRADVDVVEGIREIFVKFNHIDPYDCRFWFEFSRPCSLRP
jgi:hypothetical protein